MRTEIDAVGFDLDGTLYPNYRFYLRLLPFVLREHRMLRAMGAARDSLRADSADGRFYDLQARLMAELLAEDPEAVKDRTERLVYRGWEPLFRGLKLYRGVPETLDAFKGAGLKLGLLSDFPPSTKLKHLGLGGYWDVELCSEETGRLKPDPLPFLELARGLGVDPSRVLYVGNSIKYDIAGARGVGMKTALIASELGRRKAAASGADLIFRDYRQLRRFVLP